MKNVDSFEHLLAQNIPDKSLIANFQYLFEEHSTFYLVVGAISYENDSAETGEVFVPVAYVAVGSGLGQVFNDPAVAQKQLLDYAEYTIPTNVDTDEFLDFAHSKVVASIGGIGATSASFMLDTEEADSLRTAIDLLDALFPVIFAAAVILGGVFPGLAVMQLEREAAIMRSLGTTKKRARTMLVTEQAALCLAGLSCAAALLVVINGVLVSLFTMLLGNYAAAHLAACTAGSAICAVIVTRRGILELLQVKE
ncbi:MAG: hypothetical protein FWH33_09210 [Oscillospiraceae bacterium]|nr:hypothetical protein [Oscillospiraceae bacterium]